MNKTTFALIVGLLIFSAGGMQGRLGSLLAVFIDPASLVDTSATASTTPDAVTTANQLADTYASLNGGVRPAPVVPPGTLNQCPPGYTYNYQLQQCVFSGTTGRHA